MRLPSRQDACTCRDLQVAGKYVAPVPKAGLTRSGGNAVFNITPVEPLSVVGYGFGRPSPLLGKYSAPQEDPRLNGGPSLTKIFNTPLMVR